MSQEKQCVHCIVTGKVQGVWFRANSKKQADALNITGWVRNRADGTVEVKASGTEDDLERFLEWLNQGPDRAQVEKVIVNEIGHEIFGEFKIL